MRVLTSVFFLFYLVLVLGCQHKFGVHEVVRVDDQIKTSDDVYIKYLTDQIDRYPEEEDYYIKLANIYADQNNSTKAINVLQRADKEIPDNLNVLIHLSGQYLIDEDIKNLATTLRSIRKIDPDNMDFLKLSAGYSLLLKDYTNAIFFANRAILANPYDDENLFLRGSAQLINKDSLSALISFEEAYRLKNSFKNFSKCFDVMLAKKELSQTKQYLDGFSDQHPEIELCYEWGAYYNAAGERDTSKFILMKCLDSKKEDGRIKLELAKIYLSANDIDSTLIYANEYLASKPKGTEGYIIKARALEKINNYTNAKLVYNSALEIDSTSTLARRGLENLERKVAYLRLIKRKEDVQRQSEILKPLNSKEIN